MSSNIEIRNPLDVIQLISGNEKLHNFMNYLFSEATFLNTDSKAEARDDYFPVVSFNEKANTYDFEYEFFVKTLADYAENIYHADSESIGMIYTTLHVSTDKKIMRARFIFFAVVLGNYYRLSNSFYGDFTQMSNEKNNCLHKHTQSKILIIVTETWSHGANDILLDFLVVFAKKIHIWHL